MAFDTISRGAGGERVRDLHERLSGAGYVSMSDEPATFGDETVALVESFQRAKGLAITGVVDETTWNRLLEAGWHLGERLLFLCHPNLRGDDVAELQVRLAQLGFNPGRIDGIFGPLLYDALSDFQRNCGIEANGTLTRRTLHELMRVTPSTPSRHLVNDARDLAGFVEESSGPLVVCGASPLRQLLEHTLGPRCDVVAFDERPALEVATFANEHGAAVVLSLHHRVEGDGVRLHYWASYRSHSRRGEMLASAIASALSKSGAAARVEVAGMALPILRETKMTTLHIEHGGHDQKGLEAIRDAIASVLLEVIHR